VRAESIDGLLASGAAGVASGHDLAAAAGIEALVSGGSAVDAVLAAGFTQWVVNAPQCGPGGELLALVARGDAVTVYGGWSRAPLGIEPAAEITAVGPRAAAVPGALRGAEAAWSRCGRLRWHELFAAALDAAAGHEATVYMSEVYRRVGARGLDQALERMIGTSWPPRPGETIRLPRLAESLEEIAGCGAGALYHGALCDRVATAARSEGAWLRREDLHRMEARIDPAVRHEFADVTVWVSGPPSYGPMTSALLSEPSAGPAGRGGAADSAVSTHGRAYSADPASRGGAADPDGSTHGRVYLADPAGRAYAETAAPLAEKHLTDLFTRGPAGTTVSAAADGEGCSAVLVHSLAGVQFGTGWVAGDTGIALSNRVGTVLSSRDDLPAANPRGGEILPHTLSAAHVRRADAGPTRWITLGTSGGDRQFQWLAQSIQRFRRNESVAEIVSGPRWFVCPAGDRRFTMPAGVGRQWYAYAEPGIEWRGDERVAGYEVRRSHNAGGCLQAVVGTADGGVELGSDPRSAGGARAIGEQGWQLGG